eukprot:TRINITY_DN2509_c0_g1_i1.p1 TRINITY_DN2509_c0_g1~~TRINITY_DN2509_c0_g1_i1.p1  ORF type:complete len:304 (+),score=80.84 TRINITY_DN2509_c0_g1_i1:73-984(+)
MMTAGDDDEDGHVDSESESPDHRCEYRMAWLTEQEKTLVDDRLEDLKETFKADVARLGITIKDPIFVQGSSLWLPEGKKADDVDILVPNDANKSGHYNKLKTDCKTKYDLQSNLMQWEIARSGMRLLAAPEDAQWKELTPNFKKGVKQALKNLTVGDKFKNETNEEKNQWKNCKLRLESLIYIAQACAYGKNKIYSNDALEAKIDSMVNNEESSLVKKIYELSESSLTEMKPPNGYERVVDFVKPLQELWGEIEDELNKQIEELEEESLEAAKEQESEVDKTKDVKESESEKQAEAEVGRGSS